MWCSTFSLGMVADAAAVHEREPSLSDLKLHQRLPGPTAFLPRINSSRSQDHHQARTKAPTSPAAGSARSAELTNFTVPEVPVSQSKDQDPRWSARAGTGGDFPAREGKRSTMASKTSFQLAHPPPTIRHRHCLSFRPKILLQLQQISDATRPIPILDVIASAVFAPKWARKSPGVFKGKDGLGADDLVIVNSQNYRSSDNMKGQRGTASDGDSWDAREVVAAICQPRKKATGMEHRTEIRLNHGAMWEASPLSTGAYEFVSVDEKGNKMVARWVPRRSLIRRQTYNGHESANLPRADQRRFTFSIINPDSRRHPVIATLSRSSIDISDHYSVPAGMSRARSLPSSYNHVPVAPLSPKAGSNGTESSKMGTIETDECLRNLIMITGIWVAFREGFSSNFRCGRATGSAAQGLNHSPSHKPRSRSVNVTNLGKGRAAAAESSKREDNFRITSTTENSPIVSPGVSCSPISPSRGANTHHPGVSKTGLQPSPIIASTPASLETIWAPQRAPKSNLACRSSAGAFTASKPTTCQESCDYSFAEVARTGLLERKLTRLNKLMGFIKGTNAVQ